MLSYLQKLQKFHHNLQRFECFCFSKWQSPIKPPFKVQNWNSWNNWPVLRLPGRVSLKLSLSKKINDKFLVQSTKCDQNCMLEKTIVWGREKKIKHCQNPTSSFSLFLQTPQVQPIRHASITHWELNDKHLI